MKNVAKIKYFSLLAAFVLSSCGNVDFTYKSPAEDGGLEGNAGSDIVERQTVETLANFLKEIGKNEFYSYEVDIDLSGQKSHFINYYTPNAFYELNDRFEASIGYAQNLKKEVFKYRLSEDMKTIYPSVFVYSGEQSLSRVKNLYDAVETIPNFTFLSYSMDEFSAEYISGNKFLITDPNVSSVFQYMTSYGPSITSYVSAVYCEIIDTEKQIFRSTVELGTLGSITGLYTKSNAGPILDVNSKINHGELDGVVSYDDTEEFFDLTLQENYKIEGIFERMSQGTQTTYPTNYYITKDYFYCEYIGDYAKSYTSWGFTIIPANTEVEMYEFDENGVPGNSYTMSVAYDACYQFREYEGNYYFYFFKGPISPTGEKLVKVDTLPSVGQANTLYIIYNSETGKNELYRYENGSYSYYSDFFTSIGEYYIQDSATFYLSASPLSQIGKYYFEKSLTKENQYFSTDRGIMASLATGLFGWGWNPTNTWMDYTIGAYLDINKNKSNEIESVDISMQIQLLSEVKEMYYTLKDFGTTSIPSIESFLGGIK